MSTVGVFAVICDDQNRILCVKQNYGSRNWALPGGRVEPTESPLEALLREVREETGYEICVTRFVGVYSNQEKDDIVLSFAADIVRRRPWIPSGEISGIGSFHTFELPPSLGVRSRCCIRDALSGRTSLLREFDQDTEKTALIP